MTTKTNFRYRGYLLNCEPRQLVDGRFEAQASVAVELAGHEVVVQHFPALEYFVTEVTAAEYAKRWATRWIDANENVLVISSGSIDGQ